jgi:hypothetical protein
MIEVIVKSIEPLMEFFHLLDEGEVVSLLLVAMLVIRDFHLCADVGRCDRCLKKQLFDEPMLCIVDPVDVLR